VSPDIGNRINTVNRANYPIAIAFVPDARCFAIDFLGAEVYIIADFKVIDVN